MKLTSAFSPVGRGQISDSLISAPQLRAASPVAPVGGWKTMTDPSSGSVKLLPIRLTSTRWLTVRVGTIDSDGIRYGLTRKAWMPSARASATTMITTSSTSELPGDLAFAEATR
jgi:hypothetical protein